MYYVGFTWSDVRNLPVSIRRWFIQRFIKEISKENENSNPPLKAAHTQTPEARMFSNNSTNRLYSPNRLNRPI
jgi:hypothetical protein